MAKRRRSPELLVDLKARTGRYTLASTDKVKPEVMDRINRRILLLQHLCATIGKPEWIAPPELMADLHPNSPARARPASETPAKRQHLSHCPAHPHNAWCVCVPPAGETSE